MYVYIYTMNISHLHVKIVDILPIAFLKIQPFLWFGSMNGVWRLGGSLVKSQKVSASIMMRNDWNKHVYIYSLYIQNIFIYIYMIEIMLSPKLETIPKWIAALFFEVPAATSNASHWSLTGPCPSRNDMFVKQLRQQIIPRAGRLVTKRVNPKTTNINISACYSRHIFGKFQLNKQTSQICMWLNNPTPARVCRQTSKHAICETHCKE